MVIHFEEGAPNLDCDFPDEIWNAAVALEQCPAGIGRIMFPNRPKGYVRATRNLAHYAYNKATAMRCRLKGDITAALMYEAICERIYNNLPEYARW